MAKNYKKEKKEQEGMERNNYKKMHKSDRAENDPNMKTLCCHWE